MDDLRDMIGGRAFQQMFGSDLRKEINNTNRLAAFDMGPWLGRKLFAEDKRELAKALEIRDKERRLVGWTAAQKHLVECGYHISEGRLTTGRRLRYVVIS